MVKLEAVSALRPILVDLQLSVIGSEERRCYRQDAARNCRRRPRISFPSLLRLNWAFVLTSLWPCLVVALSLVKMRLLRDLDAKI